MKKWMRFRGNGSAYQYHIGSNKFIVQLTGGSILIRDRRSKELLKRDTGHDYLYTGMSPRADFQTHHSQIPIPTKKIGWF